MSTSIADYFVSIGFNIDEKELSKVDSQLAELRKKLKTTVQASTIKVTGGVDPVEKTIEKRTKAKKKEVDAEAEWIKKAKEAQKISNETFRTRKAIARWEAAQQKKQKQFVKAASSTPEIIKPTGFTKKDRKNISGMISERLSYLDDNKSKELKSLASYYEQQEKLAKKAEEVRAFRERKSQLEKERRARIDRELRQKALDDIHAQAIKENREFDKQQKARKRAEEKEERDRRRGYLARRAMQIRHATQAGAVVESLSRYGMMGIPFVGGAMGLAHINSASQEIQANELALNAVAGKNAPEYKAFLNDLGNKLGITTRDLQPGFTQYLASARGTQLENTIKRDFSSFIEYGAVMGLKPEEMKGSLRGITQMISKQQIYAEELKGQVAERLPAAVRLMADAMTGGDTKALIKMMEDGKLDPNEALPKFFAEMKKISDPMLPSYYKTSRFAQGKMNKTFEDLLKLFAEKGGDQGFTNFFNLMADGAKKAKPLVEALAGSFEDLTHLVQPAVTMFGRLNETLRIVSENTGIAEKNFTNLALAGGLMMTKWGRLAGVFSLVMIALEDITMGVSGKGKSLTGDFIKWLEDGGPKLGEFEKGLLGVSSALLAIAAGLKAIKLANKDSDIPGIDVDGKGGKGGKSGKGSKGFGSLGGVFGTVATVVGGALAGEAIDGVASWNEDFKTRMNNPMSPLYNNRELTRQALVSTLNPESQFYGDLRGFEDHQRQLALHNNNVLMGANAIKYGTPLPGVTPVNLEVNANIEIKSGDPEQAAAIFEKKIQDIFSTTMINMGIKK